MERNVKMTEQQFISWLKRSVVEIFSSNTYTISDYSDENSVIYVNYDRINGFWTIEDTNMALNDYMTQKAFDAVWEFYKECNPQTESFK